MSHAAAFLALPCRRRIRMVQMAPSIDRPGASVIVIDDDRDVREALQGLFRSVGLTVELFASVQDYRRSPRSDSAGCMVLDVRLPGQSGLEFFEEFRQSEINCPVIFISGHADIPMSVRAMKAGAIEFLTKPVREQDLLDAVQLAIERDRVRRQGTGSLARLQADFNSLTQREREVMVLVVAGRRNKEIASEMGISEATVKLHRGHVMQKMHALTLAALVRMADALELPRKDR
jgi:FixJ family two-component response regulator